MTRSPVVRPAGYAAPMRTKLAAPVAVSLFLSSGLAAIAQPPPPERAPAGVSAKTTNPVWPTKGWPRSTPEAERVDADILRGIHAEALKGRFGYLDSALLIRHGRIVFEHRYEHDYAKASAGRDLTPHQYNYDHPDWHPFYKGTKLHTLQSVTKSVASTLIGIAIHQKKIRGVDVAVLPWFSKRKVPDPDGRKARIRLADLLTMRAGFDWDEWTVGLDDPRNDCVRLEASKDWVAYLLEKPMATDPGTKFVYNSGASHLLSAIIRKTTGATIDTYAERHLFGPLGIASYHWKKTPRGLPDTEGGLYLLPRDLAKIGYLFLRDGMWDGRRILPEGWVEASVRPWVPDIDPGNDRPDSGYGYKWWILDDGTRGAPKTFAALGYGNQYLLVVPKLDLIGVFTAWNIHRRAPRMTEVFRKRIVPAVR